MILKSSFTTYLHSTNVSGSGKAASYLRALELLEEMLRAVPLGFEDCRDIWAVDSVERVIALRERVLEEQRRKESSPWVREGIPVSYLRDGYCSAALTQLIEFLTQHGFSQKILETMDAHRGDEADVARKLNVSPSLPDGFVHDPESKDGKERLQAIKARIGQGAFREMILKVYRNRCCLTGLNLPAEGQRMELPERFRPLREYLEYHRKTGEF